MYPSDISDKEWKMIELYFEPKKTGRPRKHSIIANRNKVSSKECKKV
ncbi:hypothetical protein [Wolbachia endosymbiont (group A) of Colletes cunicularius]